MAKSLVDIAKASKKSTSAGQHIGIGSWDLKAADPDANAEAAEMRNLIAKAKSLGFNLTMLRTWIVQSLREELAKK